MSEPSAAFGLRLKELRVAAGLTQGQLAERAGMTVRSISRLETGVQIATWPTVVSLGRVLGVDCRAFLEQPSPDTEPQGRGRPQKQAEPKPDQPETKMAPDDVKAKGAGGQPRRRGKKAGG